MRKFTNGFRLLVACVLCLAAGRAMADDEITSISVNGTEVTASVVSEVSYSIYAGAADYSPGDVEVEFGLQAVLSYLGISSIESAKQYSVNVTDHVAVDDPYGDGTTDGWHSSDGNLASWGSGSNMVCIKIEDASTGYIDYIGCLTNSCEAGETFTALYAFVAGGKAAIVRVVITYIDAPTYALSDITVEGTTECSGELYISQKTAVECSVSAEGIASALGVTEDDLEDMIDSEAVIFGAYNSSMGIKVDSLELFSTTSGCVARTHLDGGDYASDVLEECCLTDWSYGYDYEIYDFYYDPDDKTINFSIYYGSPSDPIGVDSVMYTNIYILNASSDATKAYVIKHKLTIVETPSGGVIADMNSVGGTTIEMQEYLDTSFTTSTFALPLDDAAKALGCSTSDIEVMAMGDAENLSINSSANNGGWWFDADGYVCDWGNSSCHFFIQPVEYYDFSTMEVGQYYTGDAVGDVYSTSLYLVYGDSYYLVKVQLEIIPKPAIDYDNLTNCGTIHMSVTQELDETDSPSWSDDYDSIDLSLLQDKIGTTDPSLFGTLDADDAEANDGVIYTEDYTCTPHPGFWLTADGYVKAWGDDTYWGVSTDVTSSDDALIFNCIQYPHLSADGDTYKGTFYLINRETGDYLTVILTYTIGEVTNYEEVGGESIYVPLSEDDNYVDFDMDEVLDALGVDIDELADSYCLCAKSGNTSTAMLDAGLYFDADGLCVGSNEDYSATFWFESRTDGWKLFTTGIDLEEGETITTTFYIQIDGMRWTVDITFMNTKDYETGVNTVAADKAGSSAIYDLSGRQVSKAQKGIYVTDGKKYIVK